MPAEETYIFISYSHLDDATVRRLKRDLERGGVRIWIDHERLVPGTRDWETAVRAGIREAQVVIYAASVDAAKSEFVRDEINLARGKGRDVIPFWIAGDDWLDCAPLGWGLTQYIDGRGISYDAGIGRLLTQLGLHALATSAPPSPPAQPASARPVASLQPTIPPARFPLRLATLGFTVFARDDVEWIVPPTCRVPSGQFCLGSDRSRDKDARNDELNRLVIDLPTFEIARFPVTVAEYACFLAATRRTPPGTWNMQSQLLDHPVVDVTWYDAFEYAMWLARYTGQSWRLPTEAEWEKSARCDPYDPQRSLGTDCQRIYPWGDAFEPSHCNTWESNIRTTSPIGWYGADDPDPSAGRRSGASPCGVEDLAGNVLEWTASEYGRTYSRANTSIRHGGYNRILRGGSWRSLQGFARGASRFENSLSHKDSDIGFRILVGHLSPRARG